MFTKHKNTPDAQPAKIPRIVGSFAKIGSDATSGTALHPPWNVSCGAPGPNPHVAAPLDAYAQLLAAFLSRRGEPSTSVSRVSRFACGRTK
jgi:hypothetical protein